MLATTTKLEAINSMLSAIGEAPVNSLSSGLVDAALAQTVLNEVSRSVQSQGWNFNTELDYSVASDVNGYVVLPSEIIRADLAASVIESSGIDQDYVQRGNRMYDKVNHTFTINKSLELDVVVLLDFEDLPEAARVYITTKALRVFQQRAVGSTALSDMHLGDENQALINLQEAEGDNGDYNILSPTMLL